MPDRDQEPFEVEVTAGHIRCFARAVGETNPLYLDRKAAAVAGFADVIAPPTFLVVADHFDPRFERRPRPGQPWLGFGASPSGLGDDETPPHHCTWASSSTTTAPWLRERRSRRAGSPLSAGPAPADAVAASTSWS